ncbi:DUF1549 and DUF1553 domain-containing protein [Blastopirellula marina]|uniref:BIG2 domain-containing protein n=1 Tax=Blastopirellula marina TaxID=124 RepID=A0A2S8FHR2_9BACT|nr:DUF1549 and DUF1553 domain-containing protein [Blastopirellula marina]PQO31708.1 hypothetical protein C5Y98_20050 [Blastopirellula marina]PTL43015.1 DUF1553 domain-containing protein [Blastopirellula marina]
MFPKAFFAGLLLAGFALPGFAEESPNSIPAGKQIEKVTAFPEKLTLEGPFAYAQVLITAHLESGEQVDLTRVAERIAPPAAVTITPEGLVSPVLDGTGELVFRAAGQEVKIPFEVKDSHADYQADFVRDVTPAMSKMGCNQGTCHGAKDGKNGFKLSLRGYDPLYDHRALVDDVAGRRFNRAVPEQSLMLLKTTGVVPHVGGSLTQPGERRYEILENWIAGGVQLNLDSPKVAKIDLYPQNPTVPLPGMTQQFAVYATLTDGKVIDVTDDAFISSGDIEVATADEKGILKLLRRGEAPVLARFDGAYDATTVTVMGDRTGFEWTEQPQYNYIDELVDQKLQRVKVQSSGLCTDDQFVRRLYLDLTGLPPTVDQVRTFLADSRPSQEKRNALIDELIGSGPYVEYWTNKWCDLLQVNQKYLGDPGVHALRNWVKNAVASNMPYDQMVYEILTASGSTLDHPASAYYKILRTPEDTMENTTQLFLAVRFNCNKCHDHPFERWTQNQYYHMSAYFAQVGRKEDKRFAGQRIGGSAVEGATPLVEVIYDTGSGEVKHQLTGKVSEPEFPYQQDLADAKGSRREELADWITDPHNQYFASSYVNRMWGYLFGRGIIEPIDDIRAGNPPTNPQLLAALTQSFVDSGFDTRHILREICRSRVYQQSIATNKWNEDDGINFSHAIPRRLPAEVLFDSIHQVTGSNYNLPQLPSGFRAAQLPGSDANIPFLDDFGRPARESSCECERATGVMLGPVMKLVNGPVINNAISDSNNALVKLSQEIPDDATLIDEVFLRFLGRHPSDEETKLGIDLLNQPTPDLEIAAKAYTDRRDQLLAKMPQWEASLSRVANWTPLTMAAGSSREGATFTARDDQAVLVAGPLNKDLYEVVFDLPEGTLTGLRLEVLPDDHLPSKGPGRAPNGNFVINELKAELRLADGSPGAEITFGRAEATFSQAGWDVRGAVDGNLGSGWAVSPRFGEKHTALFEVDGDVTVPAGAKLVVRMDQQYQDNQHLLGCFRLAATSSERPVRLESNVPADIREIVGKPADQRTAAEKQKLLTLYLASDATLKDLEAKQKQAEMLDANRRLAGLQDLAWALINSPAFLFNR